MTYNGVGWLRGLNVRLSWRGCARLRHRTGVLGRKRRVGECVSSSGLNCVWLLCVSIISLYGLITAGSTWLHRSVLLSAGWWQRTTTPRFRRGALELEIIACWNVATFRFLFFFNLLHLRPTLGCIQQNAQVVSANFLFQFRRLQNVREACVYRINSVPWLAELEFFKNSN